MLSSLGARRDRSRSPSDGRPPSKVFIQDDGKSVSPQRHGSSVPKVVVQEYSEETMLSSPSRCAQSLMKEGIAGAREQEMEPQQQPLQQEQQLEFTAQEQQWQHEHQQLEQHRQMFPYPHQKQSETNTQVEKPEYCEPASSQQQAAMKLPLSPQELQSRKAKALKHRPWLQKPASGQHISPDSSLASARSIQAQLESGVQGVPQQMSKAEGMQQEQIKLGQIKSEKHQKEPKKKEGEPQLVRRLSGPGAESTTAPFTHPPQKKKAQNQSQAKVAPQTSPQTASPVLGTSPEVASSPTGGQQAPKTFSQSRANPGQLQTQVQTHVPAEPQLSTSSQGLVPEPAIAHAQIWAQVRPSSPMQASLHGHIQAPVPSHIQLRSHPQSWAPVRPPSPKPPTHLQSHTQTAVQPEPMTQPQGQYLDHLSQIHSMSLPQPFYPQGYFQGQSPAQPWMPEQESRIQAMPQQRLPIPQPCPQQSYPAGSGPPQWPHLVPQVGAPGFSVDLSYTQPRMQTEALPQVIPWNSINQQTQANVSGLFHIQPHPDQVQQLARVQPSSQHQPWEFSHAQPQMLLQPQTQQPSQKALLTQPPTEAQLPLQTQPQIHLSESPEKVRPSAQLPPQAEIQPPDQSVVMKTKPQPVTEPSFPSKVELSQPEQLVQTAPVPPAQVTSPLRPRGQAQGQVKEDPSNRAEVRVGRAPSPPEYQSLIQHQVQSPGQPKVVWPTQPEPAGQTEAQSGSQPRPEGQTHLGPPSQSELPDLCVSPLTLSQAPPQAYTEAYAKAQALARNGFEEAKHCLQEHIRETISIFEDKSVSAEQVSVKEVNISVIHSSLSNSKPNKSAGVKCLSNFRSRSQILFNPVAALATEQTEKSPTVSVNCEQTYKRFSSGDSENTGPRITGGVFEGSQRHGGLLFPIAAQRHGLLHPVCQNTVGGKLTLLSR